jgi:hypothetical protein
MRGRRRVKREGIEGRKEREKKSEKRGGGERREKREGKEGEKMYMRNEE